MKHTNWQVPVSTGVALVAALALVSCGSDSRSEGTSKRTGQALVIDAGERLDAGATAHRDAAPPGSLDSGMADDDTAEPDDDTVDDDGEEQDAAADDDSADDSSDDDSADDDGEEQDAGADDDSGDDTADDSADDDTADDGEEDGGSDSTEDAGDSDDDTADDDTADDDDVPGDSDGDGVVDEEDIAPNDPRRCRDRDLDLCEDCSSGHDDINNDGLDTDRDGICNLGDLDDDNDRVPDTRDSHPNDKRRCSDLDHDGCDDCSSGIYSLFDDGVDSDGDLLCDAGDLDDDNDGVADVDDPHPLNPFLCGDSDLDQCDDCAGGSFNPAADGLDSDSDGLCNRGDPDDDNDGIPDAQDPSPLGPNRCGDADDDFCDDCTNGSFNPANDGPDLDGDGLCDLGDPDKDGDGVADASDSEPLNRNRCRDGDGDGCDDCTNGSSDFANDGPDADGDLICDAGDEDDDNDGVPDSEDPFPLDR